MVMDIHQIDYDQAAVLELDGRLDSDGAVLLENALSPLYAEHRHPIVLNLIGVDYVNSSGLRVLARYLKMAQDCSCSLRLYAVTPNVQRAIDMVGLADFFPPYEDLEAAVTP